MSCLKSLKIPFTNFVMIHLSLDPDWIVSVVSNRLDPDPNSVNTEPKHRIRQGTVLTKSTFKLKGLSREKDFKNFDKSRNPYYIRLRSVNFRQHFRNLSRETVPLRMI